MFSNLSSLKGELSKLYISSLYGASKAFLIEELIKHENQLVILLPEIKSTEELNVEMGILGLEKETILIDDFRAESIQGKLTDVTNRDKYIIISTYDLLNLKLPQKDEVDKKTTKIQAGGNISFDEIIEYLNLLNYQKDKFVEAPGEFSQRGSIIDFWSYSEHNPVRLEFDGDFLESIRHFDPESQRSIEKIDNVTLAATLEQEKDYTNHSDIFDYLQNPLIFASEFELENINHQPINLFTKDEETHADVIISDESLDDEFPEPDDQHKDIEQHETVTKTDITTKEHTRWILEEELSTSNNRIELGLTEAPSINSNYETLFSVLKDYADKSYDVILTAENELQTNRLKELLSEFKVELAELIETGKLKLETLAIKEGFLHKKEKILLLTDYQVFGKPYRTKLPQMKRFKKSKSKAFASIKRGNYVVHEDYGIGQYSGLETIEIGESNQESMKLLYNEGGVVYVNLNYLNLVKRYSSNVNLSPTLSTLGTGEWDRKKTRTKKKIKVAARELIELYAKRKAEKGFGFGTDTVWQKELEVSFLYEDTPDQEKVTVEVKEDMEAENPMDRLVCGDVGFGKTEVAVRAAFKAVQDGKQVALLV
ncbi:MAG: transcription-repair coupling factor, partial [Ignavibacteriaceae bacterium]|nr:transcription-repair coupling factor [Ignavibacteriaceae bacterium]